MDGLHENAAVAARVARNLVLASLLAASKVGGDTNGGIAARSPTIVAFATCFWSPSVGPVGLLVFGACP